MQVQTEYKSLPDNGGAPEKLIETRRLCITHENKNILSNISFSLMEGENLVLMGQSGSGKSLLVKCLSGLIKPLAGEIFIFGRELGTVKKTELAELRRKMGVIFQGSALYDNMSVKENLEFHLKRSSSGLNTIQIVDKIIEILHQAGSGEALFKMPSELSAGLKMRVALARALISRPEIILFDEPTKGLDPVNSADLGELVLRLGKKHACSSLTFTHDPGFARAISHRVILLRDGEIYAEGSFEELENSRHPWIRKFMGKTD